MAVRFNPPPGWEVPPGFRPAAGWAPDPSWPPAPPGWEYWIDEPAAVVPPPAPLPMDSAPVHPRPMDSTPTDPRPIDSAPTTPPGGAPPSPSSDETSVLAPLSGPSPTGRAGADPYGSDSPGASTHGSDPAGQPHYGASPPGPGSHSSGPVPAATDGGSGIATGHEDTSTMALDVLPPHQAPPHPGGPMAPGPLPPGPPGGAPGPSSGMIPPAQSEPKNTVAAIGQGLLGSLKKLGDKVRPTDSSSGSAAMSAGPSSPAGQGVPHAGQGGPGTGPDGGFLLHGGPVPGPGGPVRPGGPPPPVRPQRPRENGNKQPPGTGIMIGVGVAGVALGVIIGVFVTANMQADANQAITDAEKIQAEVVEDRKKLDEEIKQLQQTRDEVAQREQELGKRETELAQNERDLTEQQKDLEEQEQEEDERPGPGGDHGDEDGGFTFFFTCDDVRAAGRAPLPESDPSYRWDLDANGNGQACEGNE